MLSGFIFTSERLVDLVLWSVVLWAGPECASDSKVAPPAILMNNMEFHN